jgi:uncharacterized protein involved in type VI secretion and phage assembly
MGVTDAPAAGAATYLAEVVKVKDNGHLVLLQVRLLNYDGASQQDGPVWARVAVPFAGQGRGAFMLPDVGDEVLVTFLNGDARQPIVIGALWNGNADAPDHLGGAGDHVDRWTIVGKAGTRIAIVEESSGQATISLTTPGNVTGTLTQTSGGKIEFTAANSTITIDTNGISIRTQAKVQVNASQVQVTAGQVTVDTAMAKFSGIVKCEVLQATTVVAQNYTPGAGNVW